MVFKWLKLGKDRGAAEKGAGEAPAKPEKKAASERPGKTAPPEEAAKAAGDEVGFVTHYFPKVKAGAVRLKERGLSIGEMIYIKGHTTDFKQKIESLQIDRVPIKSATKGAEVGISFRKRVRINDKVYNISE